MKRLFIYFLFLFFIIGLVGAVPLSPDVICWTLYNGEFCISGNNTINGTISANSFCHGLLCYNLTAINNSLGSGGNSSWNQSFANSLYAPNTTRGIQQLINGTNIDFNNINASSINSTNITINKICNISGSCFTPSELNASSSSGITNNSNGWNVSFTNVQTNNINVYGIKKNVTTPSGTVTATFHYGGGGLGADETEHKIRIYSKKLVGTKYIYSPLYLESDLEVDDNSEDDYYITWSWTAVDGVDGYRILKYQHDVNEYNYEYNYNVSYDTTTNSFSDQGYDATWINGNDTYNNFYYENNITINGQVGNMTIENIQTRSIDARGTGGYLLDGYKLIGGTGQLSNIYFGEAGNLTNSGNNVIAGGEGSAKNMQNVFWSNFLGENTANKLTSGGGDNFIGINNGQNLKSASTCTLLGTNVFSSYDYCFVVNAVGSQACQNCNGSYLNAYGSLSQQNNRYGSRTNSYGTGTFAQGNNITNGLALGEYAGYNSNGANIFIIDSMPYPGRGSALNESLYSMMYGQFSSNVNNQNLTINARLNLTGVTTIGNASIYTNKVVCYLSGGTLGHCTSVVGTDGTCTCVAN